MVDLGARAYGNIAKQRAYEVKKSLRSQTLRRDKESLRKGKIESAKTINFVFRDFNKDEQGLSPHISRAREYLRNSYF